MIEPAKRQEIIQRIKDYSYYIIIGVVSVIVIFIVPLLTGCLQGDISLYFPQSVEDWIIYIVIKVSGALANVGLFVLFKLQARSNVKNNEKYLEANAILNKIKEDKGFIPKSPKQMNIRDFTTKGITVFIASLLSSVVITNLILSWDLITFISCAISTIISLVFGWIAMLRDETYWTDEYLLYAKYTQNKQESVEPKKENKLVC